MPEQVREWNGRRVGRMVRGRTLVIGLGNPILGDDGVGWRIAEEVRARLEGGGPGGGRLEGVEVDCLAVGGLALMERMIGYERAILVDAMTSGEAPQGTVSCFPLEELPKRAAGHLASAHDTTLQNALQVGRAMGAPLPEVITVVAVEAERVDLFSEELSEEVGRAVEEGVRRVMELIQALE